MKAFLLASVALALAAPALASPAQDAIKARQTHYKEIGKSMKGLNEELKKPAPSVPAVQGYAKTIATFGPQIGTWFPHGSGSEAGLKTAARAEIWSKPEEFKTAVEHFNTESAAFNATAERGDLTAIKAAFPKLGMTCKGCHDQFRVKDKD